MRRPAAATTRSRRQSTVSVSLFPFLAVLICTMGALILVLVVIARQARVQAVDDNAAELAQRRADLKDAGEMVRWQIDELRRSRQTTEEQLAGARLALGHVEDHARRLRDQLARLQATWDDLQNAETDGAGRREDLEAERDRLKAEIDNARQELLDAQRPTQERPKSYAVVPYEGPNQTRRRPIYIECRADRILLQPEGIVLTESDFAGPLGPGNPLDVALRAIREHLLARQGPVGEDSGEPYPLVLVRPGGIEAYYAVRAAMKSWASDFGYELIGEDWQLKFPPPSPGLADVVGRAIATARVRQQRLMAAAPSQYGRPVSPAYRAAPYRGGVVRANTLRGSGDSGYRPQRPFGRVAGQFGSDRRPRPDDASLPEGAVAGRPSAESDRPQGPGATAQRPGEWNPGEGSSDGEESGVAFASDEAEPLSGARGGNWGLPDASDGSVPITRPIRIDCYPDRLLLVPEEGLTGSKAISLGPETEDAIDGFVAAIWDHMDSWGIAGKGMYWRPVLNMHVAPSAEDRYGELKSLLDGSGLEVKRNGE